MRLVSDQITMSFDDWVSYGIGQGWCGAPVCSTHDGVPTTADEDNAWEQGDDLCIHVIRMYASAEEKRSVEENHSPSVWRNTY